MERLRRPYGMTMRSRRGPNRALRSELRFPLGLVLDEQSTG